jgi:hypothetical protein
LLETIVPILIGIVLIILGIWGVSKNMKNYSDLKYDTTIQSYDEYYKKKRNYQMNGALFGLCLLGGFVMVIVILTVGLRDWLKNPQEYTINFNNLYRLLKTTFKN